MNNKYYTFLEGWNLLKDIDIRTRRSVVLLVHRVFCFSILDVDVDISNSTEWNRLPIEEELVDASIDREVVDVIVCWTLFYISIPLLSNVATISSNHPLFFPPFYDYYQNRFDLITEYALYSNSKWSICCYESTTI